MPAKQEDMLEVRYLTTELRLKKRGDDTVIEGYAARFNSPSDDLGGWDEVIAPGAFAAALKDTPDVRALINHDPNLLLGRTTADTLTLVEDDSGLFMVNALPDTSAARDLAVSMARKDINQMSFAFDMVGGTDEWQDGGDEGKSRRIIKQIGTLYDVSVVTYAAYPDTSVALRGLQAHLKQTKGVDAPEVVPAVGPMEATRERIAAAQKRYTEYVARLLKTQKGW